MDIDVAHEDLQEVEEDAEEPKRHEILWFPDGNVVLKTDTYLFRVHKSILSLQSSVFKDMFQMPTGGGDDMGGSTGVAGGTMGSDGELYDGVPFVDLVDDGEDVAHLLRTVYDHGYYISRSDNHPVGKITALLLLSTKYDFRNIRQDVIDHLLKHYPTTLLEYDAVDFDNAVLFQSTRSIHRELLLDAALHAEALVLLPGLYYACSRDTLSYLLGWGEVLGKPSLATLLEGRDKLQLAMKRILWIYLNESEVCIRTHEATADPQKYRLENPKPSPVFDSVALKHVAGKKLSKRWPGRLCQKCRPNAEKLIDDERLKIWNELPSYFNLPEWEKLRLDAGL